MNHNIGAHVSISGGPSKALQRQSNINGSCGQIFAGSPRTWKVATYTEEDRKTFLDGRSVKNQGPYVIHSTYLVNLATPKDDLYAKSKNCLQSELDAAAQLGVEYVVFHPGAHTGSGVDAGIKRIAKAIDNLTIPEGVTLLLENTAGKGTTIGKTMKELRRIIDLLEDDSKVGVCIDTCHAHAAGYNLSTDEGFKSFIAEVKDELGLDYLKVLHLNDSKDPLGSEKDNHEHIGEGNIGDNGFRNVVNSPELSDLPMVLETPVTDKKGYKENIAHLRGLIE
jgi:deoxyribonuclease-4